MQYAIYTLSERTDLMSQVADLEQRSWPKFLQGATGAASWAHLYSDLSEYVLLFTLKEKVVAVGFTVPILWNQTIGGLPENIDAILKQGVEIKKQGKVANTLVPVGVLVDSQIQGNGTSVFVLQEMKMLAYSLGLQSMIVPVRPTKKTQYPLQAMSSYVTWRDKNGQLHDPWLRVHEKLGAEIIDIIKASVTVKGNLHQWSCWTNMSFPISGQYIVPGALCSVDVDCDKNVAIYNEPNVWMRYPALI